MTTTETNIEAAEAAAELRIPITEANEAALAQALAAGQKGMRGLDRLEVGGLFRLVVSARRAVEAVEIEGDATGVIFIGYGWERPDYKRSRGYSYTRSEATSELTLELDADGDWCLIGVKRFSRTSGGVGERVIHPVTGEELHLKPLVRDLEREIRHAKKAKDEEEVAALEARLNLIDRY